MCILNHSLKSLNVNRMSLLLSFIFHQENSCEYVIRFLEEIAEVPAGCLGVSTTAKHKTCLCILKISNMMKKREED